MVRPSLIAALAFTVLGATNTTPRRIAIRAPSDFFSGPESQRLNAWSQRMGFELEIAAEDAAVPAGWEAVRLSALPCSIELRRRLTRFPLRLEAAGFVFDGRSYAKPEDAIALASLEGPAETIVIGNSRRAVMRLAATRLFWGSDRPPDYEVVSGDLSKHGRFRRGSSPLAIDRTSDSDEIAAQADFLRTQKMEEREGVRWRFRESERPALEKWEVVLRRFRRSGSPPLAVRLFPDAVTKARATGSSRPADLSSSGGEILLDLDVSAPSEPDCISPMLAAAALAAQDKRLLARPTLLTAAGARAHGRWWGREIAGFAAFARKARVEPTPHEIVSGDENVSPVLAVGTAAAWLEAGARTEGEPAVRRVLIAADAECERTLSAWSALAARAAAPEPKTRPLPSGFLRGVSYAMTNTVGGSYASPRSRETLESLAKWSVNSISVMPFGYSADSRSLQIQFVHRHPAGETDEGTVRAVADAHALSMSALVKPQIWLGGGQFIGEVSMRSEEDWKRWFDSYRRFIVHEAVVAEAAGADVFCVGTELVGTEARRREWSDTIAAVRRATGAPLIYAANWAEGAARVPFWPALEAIGVDYYDPLSKDASASDEALIEGVRRTAGGLGALSRQTGKPVIFAEAGYPPVRSAWMSPHDESTGRPPAPGDAARAVAAVFRALEKETWWRGVYWWKVFSDGRSARDGERGYNLLGTPAEKTIAEAFARLAREGGIR